MTTSEDALHTIITDLDALGAITNQPSTVMVPLDAAMASFEAKYKSEDPVVAFASVGIAAAIVGLVGTEALAAGATYFLGTEAVIAASAAFDALVASEVPAAFSLVSGSSIVAKASEVVTGALLTGALAADITTTFDYFAKLFTSSSPVTLTSSSGGTVTADPYSVVIGHNANIVVTGFESVEIMPSSGIGVVNSVTVSGTGDVIETNNSSISFLSNAQAIISGTSDNLTFGAYDIVGIANPTTFTGTISGLQSGDTIDLLGVGAASSAELGTNNTLGVKSGSTTYNVSLSTSANYGPDPFYVTSDGNGGTDVMVTAGGFAQVSGYSAGLTDTGQVIQVVPNSNPFAGFVATAGNLTVTVNPLVTTSGITIQGNYNLSFVDMNDSGEVTGVATITAKGTGAPLGDYAYIYNAGVFSFYGVPSAASNANSATTIPTAINGSGEIVGRYLGTDGAWHGFTFNGTSYTTTSINGSTNTYFNDVDNNGDVVGYSKISGSNQSFVMNSAGAISTLNVSGVANAIATSINDYGEILGNNGGSQMFLDNNGEVSTWIDAGSATVGSVEDLSNSGAIFLDTATVTPYLYSNVLSVSNTDLSNTGLLGPSGLSVSSGWAKLSSTEFNSMGTYSTGSSAATIYAATAGSYDLNSKTVTGVFNLSAAQTSTNVVLTGSAAGEVITGGTGSDTLSAAVGAETLNGGSGTTNFNILWRPTSISGTVLNGGTGTNILNTWDGDLSVLTINNVPTLNANQTWVKMKAAQFAAFTTINAPGGSITIETADSGNFDLTTKTTTGIINLDATGTTGWETLTGNAAGEVLTGGYGYNTLTSTKGAETLNGGTGTNIFDVSWEPTSLAGTVINGVTGAVANTINTWDGDLSVMTVNNVPTLNAYQDWVGVTQSEFAAFTTVNAPSSTVRVVATTAGTYSLASKTVSGSFNMDASSTASNVTLIGNNQAAQTLLGGAGADTLQAGNGAGDVLTAGSGATTLTAGTGTDTLNGGAGVDTYNIGSTFGQDVINNIASGSKTTASGTISFGSGVTDEKLWLQKSGNNLLIDLLGTTDTITVQNWYGSNAGAQVSALVDTTDSLRLDAQLATLVTAMATYGAAHTGFNPQTAGTTMPTDTTLQNAITAAWHH